MAIPTRVRERMLAAAKKLFPVVAQQKTRDVSEADTVTLVKDMLADVFGYDKYLEITGEHAIRGTFCDLAVKIDDKLVLLLEVKAVGIALDDRHVKQAVDYAANQGVEWVALTNAGVWRLYHVIFAKPIDKELVLEVDLLALNLRSDEAVEQMYVLSKEGLIRGAHVELRDRQDAMSRFMLAALLTKNDQLLATMRRELKRIVGVTAGDEQLRKALMTEVIKREVLEGPEAEAACRRVQRNESRSLRAARAATEPAPEDGAVEAKPADPCDDIPTT